MEKERTSFNIRPESNVWQGKELLGSITTYDIDLFLANLHNFKISYVGMGYFGIVFRIQGQPQSTDITLKVMRFKTPINGTDINPLFDASGISYSKNQIKYFFLTDYRGRSDENTEDLAILQTAGHILGNLVAPQYIDAPVCLWARKTRDSYEAVGYSLPYVQGEKVRVCKDAELTLIADNLEGQYNLFVGDRGKTLIRGSKNAMVCKTGQKKFIDVRLKDSGNYSFPIS